MQQWDAVWLNVNIATMVANTQCAYGTIENAAIAIKEGAIAWLGSKDALPEFDALSTPIYDGKGNWITPGLIDCHTHLIFGGNRANEFEMRLSGASYEDIAKQGGGILSTVKATREASAEALFVAANKHVNALMAEGVTTVEVKSGYGLDTANEIKMLEVAQLLNQHHVVDVQSTFLGAHALPAEYKDDADGYIDVVCNEMLPQVAERGLAVAVDVFCEGIGFSYQQTERVLTKAKELGLKVKLHAEQLSDLGGAGLVADLNGLSADHIEYISEASIEKMAKSGTVAVVLPGAFYTLRETKLPPFDLFRKHQLDIAVASDFNPGSSPICSLQLMMNMACTLFRLTPSEALAGVTRNAAKALGLDDRGTLEVGKRADFALWDIAQPAQLAYQFGCNPLQQLVIAGNVVKQ
ncbi:imidazolonepropionase [Flocculibacter collagenilyticus]|uniref:imidazolonepropionase n=1 Tax=Flocculibacter collagenilyticus TaxID=2744479 RepID=UPI0018F30EA6|nr:imidazolonepropionase [Flocculibacter collagenilyticus]